MRVVPVAQLKEGVRLAQNIFRHDGLLAFAKGTPVKRIQKETLQYLGLEFVMVHDGRLAIRDDDTNFMLQILESAYRSTSVWGEPFGRELYVGVSHRILKNGRIGKYLNQLRVLDSYSFAHCINVSIVIALLLRKGERVDDGLIDITYLTLIHDIGRIKMGDIFEKEGKLTEEEFEKVRRHPEWSYKLLKKAGLSPYDIQFVLETHEKYDGSGYPLQIRSTDIQDLAQLVYISDVYNALSSYRPYRTVFPPHEVIEMIEAESNVSFGDQYVDVFLKKFRPYQVGAMVELNDGRRAFVKRVAEHRSTLPVVDVVSEQTGETVETVDLWQRRDVRIVRVVHEE